MDLALGSLALNSGGFALNPFATASFFAPLTSSLALTRGTGVATFARATAATVMGFAADALPGDAQVLLTVAAGEARFTGARRISQGVWSDYYADGTLIPEALRLGYLAEGAATNLFLNSAVGVTQTTPTLTAVPYTLSFKGTGTITGTGGFVGTKTGTGVTDRVSLTVTASALAAVLTVTGSCTEVQLERGSFATSYIPTTSTAVTRNVDILNYVFSGNALSTVGTAFAESSVIWAGSRQAIILGFDNTASATPLYLTSNTSVSISDGTNTASKTGIPSSYLATTKFGSSWGAGMKITSSALTPAPSNFDGVLNNQSIAIGGSSGGGAPLNGNIRNVHLWTTQLTDAQLVTITS